MPLVLALEEAYARPRPIRNSIASSTACSSIMSVGRAALFRRAADRPSRRREDLFKREELNHTARTRSTTCSANPAGAADGQDAHHRRDRAGQHGVATATACARFGLKCVVYMGAVDIERQKPTSSA